jgi:hypothetical protein
MQHSILATDLLDEHKMKPFLYGVLFSRLVDNKDGYFYAYTCVRVSKFLPEYDFPKLAKELAHLYDVECDYENWEIHKIKPIFKEKQLAFELRFWIKNDTKLKIDKFNDKLYDKLCKEDWLHKDLTPSKKKFTSGFMEMRGNISVPRRNIKQSFFFADKDELNRMLIFPNNVGTTWHKRKFTDEDIAKAKHKRKLVYMGLDWYAKEIGFINRYKRDIYNLTVVKE